jgi:hypothetical protein
MTGGLIRWPLSPVISTGGDSSLREMKETVLGICLPGQIAGRIPQGKGNYS